MFCDRSSCQVDLDAMHAVLNGREHQVCRLLDGAQVDLGFSSIQARCLSVPPVRGACMGSIRSARSAGTRHAAVAGASRQPTSPGIITPSSACVWYSCERITSPTPVPPARVMDRRRSRWTSTCVAPGPAHISSPLSSRIRPRITIHSRSKNCASPSSTGKPHSYLRATIGSTCMVRRAGT